MDKEVQVRLRGRPPDIFNFSSAQAATTFATLLDGYAVIRNRSVGSYLRHESEGTPPVPDRVGEGSVPIDARFGRISRQEAESILVRHGSTDGLYVLRESESGGYGLSGQCDESAFDCVKELLACLLFGALSLFLSWQPVATCSSSWSMLSLLQGRCQSLQD